MMRQVGIASRWASVLPGVLLGVLLAAGPASSAPPTPAPVVQSIIDCRKVAEAAARLACYDKAADGIAKAEASGDLVTIDREQRRTLRRQAFGFTLPSLSMFDRGEKTEENERLTATVTSAAQNGLGKWVLTLDSGAVWIQTDDTELYPTPKAGVSVVVKKAALGSYFILINGHQQIRAERRS
jgi:hypothetical protein